MHSHITYGIQAWGNGNTKKLEILQKRVLRIINKKEHRSHTEPLFKSKYILKIVVVFQLQASLFMHNVDHNLLAFRNVVIKKNVTTYTRINRQFKLLVQEKPRTNFSSKLPRHNLQEWGTKLMNK